MKNNAFFDNQTISELYVYTNDRVYIKHELYSNTMGWDNSTV